MKTQRITETQLIDVLLGQADPEIEIRVREQIDQDPRIAALYQEWADVLPLLRSDRKSVQALTQRACDKLMAQIESEPSSMPVSASLPKVNWLQRMGWKQTVPALATAVCAFAFFGYWMESKKSPIEDVQPREILTAMNTRTPNPAPLSSIRYVEFESNDAVELGTESQPFKTLADGIKAIDAGGVIKIKSGRSAETVRIDKPVKLMAMGGAVRIGKM